MHLALVLHSHLPWLRGHGTYPVGEEWLFQAWSESHLPLIDVLERLAEAGHRDVLTVGITPVLAEQMDDTYLLREFHGWLGRRLVDLEYTVARCQPRYRPGLAEAYRDHWRRQRRLLEAVESRFLASGLTAPFAALADAGVIELLGGPATHPYLPLMGDPALIRGQIETGLATWQRHFGHRPRGVWSPECGYRPAGPVADPTDPHLRRTGSPLPGLEDFWAEAGVSHLVLDGPTLGGATDHPVLIGDSDVAAFGRNLDVSYQVWSPEGGYPADPAYRDYHTIDLDGGFKSWRVTDPRSPDKLPYDPLAGRERAVAHGRQFVDLVAGSLQGSDGDAVVVAAYDTELFGHWWYEGPVWLETVLRAVAGDARLQTATLGGYLDRHPPERRMVLPESSWGSGKDHRSWANERTRWIWEAIRDAEARFSVLPPEPAPDTAWRQLTLLQSSDWPFMVTRDQAAGYAAERVRAHLEAFDAASAATESPRMLTRLNDKFTPFVDARSRVRTACWHDGH